MKNVLKLRLSISIKHCAPKVNLTTTLKLKKLEAQPLGMDEVKKKGVR